MNVKVKGVTLGSIAAASYGMNPLFALPLYSDGMTADSMLFYRYVLAILLMGGMMLLQRRSFKVRGRELLSLAMMGIVFSASSLLLFLSYQHMDAGIASTILFMYPVLVALIMWLFFHERADILTWTCITLAFVGISLLYRGKPDAPLSTVGIVLVLLSSLSYAIYIVGVNRSVLRQMDSETLTFYALIFGSLLYVLRLIGIDTDAGTFQFNLQFPTQGWLWVNLFCLALFPTIISLVTMNLSIHYIGSTPAAILGALEPITALIIGVGVFGEVLTPRIVLGIILVLSAVTLLIAGRKLLAIVKTKFFSIAFVALLFIPLSVSAQQRRVPTFKTGIPTDSIILSDPFILADTASQTYYMTGTGGLMWTSKDLRTWDGPRWVLELDTASWMGPRPQIWAAEIHQYNGKYYFFSTFTNNNITIDSTSYGRVPRRATHILVADKPDGPYRMQGDNVILSAHEATLDGTLWVDTDNHPYMVYCHEWIQTGDGTMEKIRLKDDLSGSIYNSFLMFRASDAPWSTDSNVNPQTVAPTRHQRPDGTWPNVVTDGPWVFRTQTGRLGLIWTSWRDSIYTTGVAYSRTGTLDGPWEHEQEPLLPPNYGHGMMFHDWKGRLLMSVHSHSNVNGHFVRHPHFFLMDDEGATLRTLAHFNP